MWLIEEARPLDLTHKVTPLVQSRKVLLEAIIRSGIEPSIAIAMHREDQLHPLILALRDPNLIRYVGTDAESCLQIFKEALVNEGLTRPQRRNLMADEF